MAIDTRIVDVPAVLERLRDDFARLLVAVMQAPTSAAAWNLYTTCSALEREVVRFGEYALRQHHLIEAAEARRA